ncbi:MAG: MotE family protein [Sphingomonas sp.]
MIRLPLLVLTAAAAGLSVAAHTVEAAGQTGAPESQTRLGATIGSELAAQRQRESQRAHKLDMQEQALKATQARLSQQVAAQQQEQQQAAQPTAGAAPGASPAEDASTQRYSDLARIYQAMKPAQAAVVFEQLEPDVQLHVAQRMQQRAAGLIMAQMTPSAAAALSMAMARGVPMRAPAAPKR